MEVSFNETLKNRTIAFCEDELNYHINESGCANEYHDETCAEIELLYRLGKKRSARSYKRQYLAAINSQIEDRKDLRALKEDFNKFWDTLVA